MSEIVLLTLARPASLDEIKTLRDATAKVLAKLRIDGEHVNKAKLAISEWTTNIVKHAEHPATYVKLVISQIKPIEGDKAQSSQGQQIVISIEDNSTYFEAFSQRQSQITSNLECEAHQNSIAETQVDLVESGMGLGIIFNLFANCTYQQKTSSVAIGDHTTNLFTFFFALSSSKQ